VQTIRIGASGVVFREHLPGVLALGSLILVVSFVVVFISQWLRSYRVEKTQPGI